MYAIQLIRLSRALPAWCMEAASGARQLHTRHSSQLLSSTSADRASKHQALIAAADSCL